MIGDRIARVFANCMTGIDGQSHDIGRWSWLICTLAVIGGAAANSYHGHDVDLTALGLALSGVAAAHGIAISAKKATEPT